MPALELWCRVRVLGPDRTELAYRVLEGPGAPDLEVVDYVARLALLAQRIGGGIVLGELSPALQGLLELAGLSVEVQGQAEFGEQPLGVEERQEERHPGDRPV